MKTKIQVSEPSKCCNSYYRTVSDDKVHRCNLCGEVCLTVREKPDVLFVKRNTARKWSKKKHRFLRYGEA